MIVVKFGGTSLAGTERMRAAARIVAAESRGQHVVCVVSAMAGITDALIRATTQTTIGGRTTTGRQTLIQIREQHQQTLTGLTTTTTTTTGSIPTITTRFEQAWAALEADLATLLADDFPGEAARAHARAAFSGWGERLSALLFAAALAAEGVAAQEGAAEPVVMVERGGAASAVSRPHPSGGDAAPVPWERLIPSVSATRAYLRPLLADALESCAVTVLPGYLARAADGFVTTLGRNGSDASAALIAAALGAEALYIYSDVPGVRRADPRAVPDAALLPRLTYADAAEIALLGARILHPATLRPLAAAGIPLRLRSSFAPDAEGTDIGPAALLWDHRAPTPAPSPSQDWIVVAHPLTATNPLFDKQTDETSGLIEVTGLFLRHADLEATEDDQLTAGDPAPSAESSAVALPGDGPISGALALLAGSPRPFGLSLSARRISVAVQSDESPATQRHLYLALEHADERARLHSYAHDVARDIQGDALLTDRRRSS